MFRVKLSGDCDKSPTGYNLGIFKDYEKGEGYLENDQVEPGVRRGGYFPKAGGTAGNK